MEISEIHIKKEDPFDALLPRLDGKIFHVSKKLNWEKIKRTGKLIPNRKGDLATTFGSKSYFGEKGCVCLFDYRNIYDDNVQKFIHRCRPTSPLTNGHDIVIFILSPCTFPKILYWDEWKKDGSRTNIVPYVEVGFPGEIELGLVDQIIFVSFEEDTNYLSYKLRNARNRRAKG